MHKSLKNCEGYFKIIKLRRHKHKINDKLKIFFEVKFCCFNFFSKFKTRLERTYTHTHIGKTFQFHGQTENLTSFQLEKINDL